MRNRSQRVGRTGNMMAQGDRDSAIRQRLNKCTCRAWMVGSRVNPSKAQIRQTITAFANALTVAAAFLCGCIGPAITKDVASFENAGPLWPDVELRNLARGNKSGEPYRVVTRDVLELQLPAAALTSLASKQQLLTPVSYLCRVSEAGSIALPIVGSLRVAGKTLSEIEGIVTEAYYPRYLIRSPSVLVRIKDYHTVKVSVSGAVENPGVYDLRNDELSLVTLLTKAGGILKEGAGTIRIQAPKTEELVLPVYGLRFPPSDVVLKGGERVLVEQVEPQLFTVVGLVKKPGAYPYPPGAKYNLMQAVAIAGGINELADPKYAKIYRNGGDGNVLVGCFKICGRNKICSSAIDIKPGDVVTLEHTARTRTRMLLAAILRIGAGINVGATYSPAGN
jgi:protein involved in polysaccharide export with SLBB domain